MKFRSIIGVLVLLFFLSPKVKAQEASDSSVVEEIVVFSTRGINPSGARYHLDGCRYLKNGQIKVDERQALNRGLLPCSVCLPDRASALPFLRTKSVESRPKAFRKCVFKTKIKRNLKSRNEKHEKHLKTKLKQFLNLLFVTN